MKTFGFILITIIAAALSTGCQNTSMSKIKDEPFVIDDTYRTVKPAPQPPPGSIYRGVTSNSSFLGDHRARGIGDIITVNIVEVTNATEKAGTSTKRSSATTAGIPNFFGFENNVYPSSITPDKMINANTKNDFDGSGETTRGGSLTATITARVVDVLPNGNLAIEGKREISINNEKKEILVQGIVRPRDLAYDNSVYSTQIADAKIIYTGVGVLGEKQRPGWMARMVDAVWPF
ncbi:MAG TPA: flagellar biosynthesis protein FlgH [Deltaproteobacteria bacterium]|nr:flagellar biosynthesis protein FlgH [Deltaproteobacteria bacterium]